MLYIIHTHTCTEVATKIAAKYLQNKYVFKYIHSNIHENARLRRYSTRFSGGKFFKSSVLGLSNVCVCVRFHHNYIYQPATLLPLIMKLSTKLYRDFKKKIY